MFNICNPWQSETAREIKANFSAQVRYDLEPELVRTFALHCSFSGKRRSNSAEQTTRVV
jgi:hypothetical protein